MNVQHWKRYLNLSFASIITQSNKTLDQFEHANVRSAKVGSANFVTRTRLFLNMNLKNKHVTKIQLGNKFPKH